MHVRPTALLVGDENQALPADSGSLSPPVSPPVSPSRLIYHRGIARAHPLAGEQVALYHAYEGLRNVR